jgi:hypothetical protein
MYYFTPSIDNIGTREIIFEMDEDNAKSQSKLLALIFNVGDVLLYLWEK